MINNSNYLKKEYFPSVGSTFSYFIVKNKKLSKENTIVIDDNVFTTSINISVEGPKFNLDSSLVHSVFPPVGGKGDYRAVLPKNYLKSSISASTMILAS